MVRVPSGGSLMSSLRCTSLYFANDVPQTHDAGINRPRAQPGLVRPPHTWEPHINLHRESPGVVRPQSHPTTPGIARSRSTSLCFVSRFKNPHYAECLQSIAFFLSAVGASRFSWLADMPLYFCSSCPVGGGCMQKQAWKRANCWSWDSKDLSSHVQSHAT